MEEIGRLAQSGRAIGTRTFTIRKDHEVLYNTLMLRSLGRDVVRGSTLVGAVAIVCVYYEVGISALRSGRAEGLPGYFQDRGSFAREIIFPTVKRRCAKGEAADLFAWLEDWAAGALHLVTKGNAKHLDPLSEVQ